MKKFIFLTAAAVVAMAGCTKQFEPAKTFGKQEITFSSPVIAPSTRAIINSTTYASTDGSFGVYSVWSPAALTTWSAADNKPFMSNVEVSYAAAIHNSYGGWKPAQAYFWPNAGKLNFLAYRPYSATCAINGDWLQFSNYTVDMTADPEDLLYSSLVKDKVANAEVNSYYGVDIPFHHALSQITFNAKTKADYTTGVASETNNVVIKLTSVKLSAKNTSATGTQSADAAISWAAATNKQQSREIVKAAIELSENYIGAPYPANFEELLAMPQDFTSDDEVVLDITYTVNFTALDDDNSAGTTVAEDFATKTETVKLNTLTFSDGNHAFAPNKKYILNIIIGLDEVSFAPRVVDWDETAISADSNVVYVNS